MLYLLFELDGDRYALDIRQVVEVVPQVESKTMLGARPSVAGLMNYRGKPVPLLDLTQLVLGRPCARRMSTRIIVTNRFEAPEETCLVGLLAERVTETIRRGEADFKDVHAGGRGGTFSGPVLTEGNMLVQRVDLRDLIPRSLQDELFAEIEQPPHDSA